MATPITIYYESDRNATKESNKKSLTPSFIDGIIDSAAVGLGEDLDNIQEAVQEWFSEPKPVDPNDFTSASAFGSQFGELQNEVEQYEEDSRVINTLSFHAIIGETHSAQTEITKFPTQAGFEISNHAIRKNRVIEVEAIITNTLLNAVGSRQMNYGLDNSLIVFEALEALVNSATVCSVSTNLGLYWPVVFTKFRTKQELGMVDSLKFVLSGEEVLVQDAINKTAPKQITFSTPTGAQCDVAASEKARDGYLFQCGCADAVQSTLDNIYGVNPGIAQGTSRISASLFNTSTSRTSFLMSSLDNGVGRGLINSTAVSVRAVDSADLREDAGAINDVPIETGVVDYQLGEDFIIEAVTTAGKPYKVTYVALGYDFTTQKHRYEVHSSNTEVYVPPVATPALIAVQSQPSTKAFTDNFPISFNAIDGAATSVSNCLLMGAGDLAYEKGQDLIDTGMGKMRESINGVITDVVNMGGIDGSDSLLGMGLDCVSSQVYGEGVGFEEAGDILADDIDNATNKILRGAAEYGGSITSDLGGTLNGALGSPTLAGANEAVDVAKRKAARFFKIKVPVDDYPGA